MFLPLPITYIYIYIKIPFCSHNSLKFNFDVLHLFPYLFSYTTNGIKKSYRYMKSSSVTRGWWKHPTDEEYQWCIWKHVETREIRKKKRKRGKKKKKCYLGSSDDRKVMTSILRLPRIKRRAVPVLHLVPPVSACLFWLACPRLPFCQLYLLFHSYGRRLDHEPCPFTRTAAHARSLAPDGYPIG